MIRKITAVAALALTACLPASAGIGDIPAGTYKLDPTHGYISFSYTHLGFSNPIVGFETFDVTLELNQDDVSDSTLSVEIDPASISSRVEEFDGHLRGERFFDVETYDSITFVATEIKMTGEDTLSVTGDLTIKDITKSVTLDATINKTGNHPMKKTPTIGVSATATINRSDWGLDYAVPAVTDAVTLDIQAELLLAE